ncbi:YfbR-like 5'-deoxynucleotidase [Bartonella raoultii]|uniref:HD family hydrolase n=1 Tax=Bartonella raoultii TaxID=1457020 RepID=A0ABS7I6L0_9HYPH|nr:HD family hydrolase [Bartonella raoultii]MBX4336062.1 HD family hydrolase [Bartonella raoultii]
MAKAELSKNGEARAWQRMLSGRRLDLLNPSPFDIEIEDIAHGLARVARWNGQTRGEHAYSVAQHSLLVEQIFYKLFPQSHKNECLYALLHDAPEYVIGDMISPFKAVIGNQYERIEKRIQDAIHMRFSLPIDPPQKLLKKIKQADRIAAFHEAITLAGFNPEEALFYFGSPNHILPDDLNLQPCSTQQIENAFLMRFKNLDAQKSF